MSNKNPGDKENLTSGNINNTNFIEESIRTYTCQLNSECSDIILYEV